MKKVIPFLTLASLMLTAGIVRAQSSCPSVSCTSTGSLSLLSGSYGCTEVQAQADGTVKLGVVRVTFTPATGLVKGVAANNGNQSSGNTYSDFSANNLGASYCVNSDNTTGYLIPEAGLGCPLALVAGSVDKAGVATQIRLINTKQQKSDTVVCKLQ
jgi:hypothetical protein